MIRVLIAHEQRLVCSLIAAALQEEEDIKIVGYATSMAEAIEKAERSDVLLVDVSIPDDGAMKIAQHMAVQKRNVDVIVVGVPDNTQVILRYVEAGADGYVLAEVTAEELLESIKALQDDKTMASPDVVRRIFQRVHELSILCANQENLIEELENLTPRESEVLDLISEGLSNQEIGQKLSIQVGTVKNHVHKILDKLDVSSRHEAASIYRQSETARNHSQSSEE